MLYETVEQGHGGRETCRMLGQGNRTITSMKSKEYGDTKVEAASSKVEAASSRFEECEIAPLSLTHRLCALLMHYVLQLVLDQAEIVEGGMPPFRIVTVADVRRQPL